MKLYKGIACAGTWIIDHTKVIDKYPQENALALILSESLGGGGCPYNVIINLAKFDSSLPLAAIGLIGNDSDGDYIKDECSLYPNINSLQLQRTDHERTSFTDVYNVKSTGRRTFFHNCGANRLFGPDLVDFNRINADICHLGYLLLMERMDQPDSDYGTVAARFLHELQKRHIKTSLDLVSEDSERFSSVVQPALKYTDYLIINDFEAEKLTQINIRSNGRIIKTNLPRIARRIFAFGVSELLVIHFPEGSYLTTKSGREIYQPSLSLPDDYIVGSTGAGDSFCAGILYGLYCQWELLRTVQFATCAGAQNLAHLTTTGSITAWQETFKLSQIYSFRKDM
jgi:sugar/nucleoside kinase (ribokinase family)